MTLDVFCQLVRLKRTFLRFCQGKPETCTSEYCRCLFPTVQQVLPFSPAFLFYLRLPRTGLDELGWERKRGWWRSTGGRLGGEQRAGWRSKQNVWSIQGPPQRRNKVPEGEIIQPRRRHESGKDMASPGLLTSQSHCPASSQLVFKAQQLSLVKTRALRRSDRAISWRWRKGEERLRVLTRLHTPHMHTHPVLPP